MPAAEVRLNGAGPFHFAVDTGAGSTLISTRLAAAARLKADYRVEMVTAAGSRIVPATAKTALSVPGLEVPNVEVLWCDWPLPDGVDGILGQSFLAGQSYRIDTRAGLVTFGAFPVSAGQTVPIEWIDGRMAVKTMAPGRRTLHLIVDSGASEIVLWPKRPLPLTDVGQAVASSHAGSSSVPLVRIPWLQIGFVRLKEPLAGLMAGDHNEDGLLATRHFRHVYVLGDRVAFEH
ncbi:aspartyl protease family protein [Paludibaculum fermentans]|uniref:aspartyl protease family protein n=1 Tax=Paludibaculum fermentans TaxID=1473598 RepID=UPI003EB8CA89